jgi:hypothetical protein
MGNSDLARLLDHAKAVTAYAVCIRSSNAILPGAIAKFHQQNVKVYAWRWPAVVAHPHSGSHYYAIDEANYVVQSLLPQGLDGYIVDPESDGDGDSNDWNHASLAPLAKQFCKIIKDGAQAAGNAAFHFGVTSGCTYPVGKPNIPWAAFAAASDTLYPQSYWRWTNPHTGQPQNINGGNPSAAIKAGVSAWKPIAAGKPVVPMAGELDVITSAEIAVYGTSALQVAQELHFYTDTGNVPGTNIEAIAAL